MHCAVCALTRFRSSLGRGVGTGASCLTLFGPPLCAVVFSGGPTSWLQTSDKPEQGEEVHFQLLRMIRTLSRLMPTWLVKNRGVVDAVLTLWRSPAKRLR